MPLLPYARDDLDYNTLRVVANAPEVLAGLKALNESVFGKGQMEPKLRELAILSAVSTLGSTYQWTHHVPSARGAGVTDDQIGAIERGETEDAGCFDERESLVVRFAREITLGAKASRETVEGLRRHLSPEEIVRLTAAVGYWNILARFVLTFEVELEPWAGTTNVMAHLAEAEPG
jgi:4-carboxymuconolactone decarboxylase